MIMEMLNGDLGLSSFLLSKSQIMGKCHVIIELLVDSLSSNVPLLRLNEPGWRAIDSHMPLHDLNLFLFSIFEGKEVLQPQCVRYFWNLVISKVLEAHEQRLEDIFGALYSWQT